MSLLLRTVCIAGFIAARAMYSQPQAPLTAPEVESLRAQAGALAALGEEQRKSGGREGALDLFGRALALCRRAGDRLCEVEMFDRIGVVSRQLGQYGKALEAYEQILAIWRQRKDAWAEGVALEKLGEIYFEWRKVDKALELYQQALDIHRRVSNRSGQAATLGKIGRVYDEQAKYDEALQTHVQARQIRIALRDPKGTLEGFLDIASVLIHQGQGAEALEVCNEALKLARVRQDRQAEGAILSTLGLVFDKLDQHPQALQAYEQALKIQRETGDEANQRRTLHLLVASYASAGEYVQALAPGEQALEMARKAGDRQTERITSNDLGVAHQKLGRYAKALQLLDQALALFREVGDRANEGAALNNIALVYSSLGLYAKALESYQQALAAVEDKSAGSILQNIGLAYRKMEQFPKALEFYQRALEMERLAHDPAAEGVTLSNAGVVYEQMGDYAKALEFCQQALAIQRKLGDQGHMGASLNSIGNVYDSLGQDPKALEFFQEARGLARQTGDAEGEAMALRNIGRAHEKSGDFPGALQFYRESIAVQESIRALASIEEFKIGLGELSSEVYQRAILLLMRMGRPEEAFELAERARARNYLDQAGNARLDFRRGADAQLVQQEQARRLELAGLEKALRGQLAKPRSGQDAELVQSVQARISVKQREYEDLLTQLKLSNPGYASLVAVSPLSLRDVQKRLDANTTLLAYFVTPEKTLAFVVTRDSFWAAELPVTKQELSDTVAQFRDFASLSDSPPPSLMQLRAWLVAPLSTHLKTPIIGIIPHGVLHYLPFAALTDGKQYLSDEHALFHLPSASTLQFIRQGQKDAATKALVMAQSQVEGLPRLRHADEEASTIAKLYNTRAILGKDATESTFHARAGDSSLVHLAAHGRLDAASPLFSRIILAPDKDSDGFLEVHEVYGVDLRKTDLVVLSACQTQMGALSRGDDLIGLTRAFLSAGARTVIASLWNVDDESTGYLVSSFYRRLKDGANKAEALRGAQAETRAKYVHPYYWSAFVLTGDAGTASSASRLP